MEIDLRLFGQIKLRKARKGTLCPEPGDWDSETYTLLVNIAHLYLTVKSI